MMETILAMEEEHADDLVSLLEVFGNWYRLAKVLRRFERCKVHPIPFQAMPNLKPTKLSI